MAKFVSRTMSNLDQFQTLKTLGDMGSWCDTIRYLGLQSFPRFQ